MFFLCREKLPTKYQRLFNEMQQLMDPSRNMSRYRNLLNGDEVQPPVIPFYPVVKKDLTFIHIANDSKMDGLVNFEKLRMIAKEVWIMISSGVNILREAHTRADPKSAKR